MSKTKQRIDSMYAMGQHDARRNIVPRISSKHPLASVYRAGYLNGWPERRSEPCPFTKSSKRRFANYGWFMRGPARRHPQRSVFDSK